PVARDINNIGDAASDLGMAADVMQPNVKDVTDKAMVVINRMLMLDADVTRSPAAVADYADKIKTLAIDQIALGNIVGQFSEVKETGMIDCADPNGTTPWDRKNYGTCELIIEIDDLAGRIMDDGTAY
ncbi:MAG: hypothetical protein ABI224_08430, partial [Acetobacteraceae bacterium]